MKCRNFVNGSLMARILFNFLNLCRTKNYLFYSQYFKVIYFSTDYHCLDSDEVETSRILENVLLV